MIGEEARGHGPESVLEGKSFQVRSTGLSSSSKLVLVMPLDKLASRLAQIKNGCWLSPEGIRGAVKVEGRTNRETSNSDKSRAGSDLRREQASKVRQKKAEAGLFSAFPRHRHKTAREKTGRREVQLPGTV